MKTDHELNALTMHSQAAAVAVDSLCCCCHGADVMMSSTHESCHVMMSSTHSGNVPRLQLVPASILLMAGGPTTQQWVYTVLGASKKMQFFTMQQATADGNHCLVLYSAAQ
jgi:hypothetical protein